MKFTFVGLTSLAIAAQAASAANCECDSGDTVCLNNCVENTNSCINACNGDTACYQDCISNGWPGISQPTSSINLANSTTAASGASSVVPVTPEVVSSASGTASSEVVSPASSVVATTSPTASTSAEASNVISANSSSQNGATATDGVEVASSTLSASAGNIDMPTLGLTLLSVGLAMLGFQ